MVLLIQTLNIPISPFRSRLSGRGLDFKDLRARRIQCVELRTRLLQGGWLRVAEGVEQVCNYNCSQIS